MDKIIGMAYARVSTEDQAEYSPAIQVEDILDYAQKNNIYIPEEYIFIDEGISGKSADNRPAFMEMIKTARKKSNNVGVIIVHKFDRFSRKKDDQVLYKALLKKDGIKVISVKEPIPDDDKFAVIYESMLEAMSEYYSLNLAEEVKKTMVKKAERGEYQSTAPFGYKNENKTLVIVQEEAEIVKMIYDKYLNDNMPMLQIVEMINNMGIRTHRGNVFENRTVQYILNNPVYCGYVRWSPQGRIRRDFHNDKSIIAKGTHEPIISLETYQQATEKWKEGKIRHKPKQRPVTEGKHWLSGLIKCSNCGRSLVILRWYKDGNFSMQCGGYNHGQCRVTHSLTSRTLIPALLNELKNIIDNTDINSFSIKFTDTKQNDSDLSINKTLLNKAKSRLTKAKEAYLAGIDSIDEYKQNKINIESEIDVLEEKISKLLNKSKNPLNDETYKSKIKDLYDCLIDPNVCTETKKISIRKIIDKIVYDKRTGLVELYFYRF